MVRSLCSAAAWQQWAQPASCSAGMPAGSIEPGRRADLVLHDRDRPEWTPLHDVVNQLVYSADGRSVHTVFVDGRKVVDGYRATRIDEGDLYTKADHAAASICRRVDLPAVRRWRRTSGLR